MADFKVEVGFSFLRVTNASFFIAISVECEVLDYVQAGQRGVLSGKMKSIQWVWEKNFLRKKRWMLRQVEGFIAIERYNLTDIIVAIITMMIMNMEIIIEVSFFFVNSNAELGKRR